jgi:hypothetical protein
MGKYLKIILIALAFLALGVSMHFNLLTRLPLVRNFYENAVLTVNSRRSPANIYLDGVDYGQTPLTIPNLPEGGHTVELERISESSDTYPKQSFYIELYPNTEAVIDVEIAPNNFKSGHILFYSPMPRTFNQEGALSIRSDVSNYEILIDDERIDKSDIISYKLEPNEYDIKVTSEGYESLEFPVIVREGYDLNVRVYLLPIPIVF